MNAVVNPFLDAEALTEAFPDVDADLVPFGERVLVQIRTPKTKSKGGIILHREDRETEKWNTQVGKVIALGPTAFKNRDTLKPWPEGDWCKLGDYVRVPKYGGDRFEVLIPGKRGRDAEDFAIFIVIKDLELGGLIKDPLKVIAYI